MVTVKVKRKVKRNPRISPVGKGPRWEGADKIRGVPTTAKVDENQLIASICKESFFEFVKEFWDTVIPETPVWNWHIRFLCDEAQEVAERVFRGERKEYDLVVNIPPGTTKSTILSVMFPAWLWTRMPSCRYIGASYSYSLAMDLSRKCRDVILSDKYRACFPHAVLREDQNTKGYFANTRGGYRYAVGVNGSVTGMHAHVIVIDDPLDPNQSVSAADLKASNHWIRETLPTRKVDKRVTPTILVMQRLHQEDPTTIFLRKKRVRHVCLPAQAKDGVKPLELERFYKKGLLDPVRMPKSVLKEAFEDLGQFGYAGQYRQHPVPRSGRMFKVNKVVRGVPPPREFLKVVRGWDKAGSQEKWGAFTVGTKMGLDRDGRFWVLDVVRGRWNSATRESIIEKTAEEDGYECQIVVEQEPGSGGKESAENTVRRLAGFRVKVIKVDASTGGKERRADPWSVQVNAGNVYVVEDDWVDDWLEEHRYFPDSKYKDQVDSAALTFSALHKKRIRVGGMLNSDDVDEGD